MLHGIFIGGPAHGRKCEAPADQEYVVVPEFSVVDGQQKITAQHIYSRRGITTDHGDDVFLYIHGARNGEPDD